MKTSNVDYDKMQYVRLHVAYGNKRFNVDVPVPGIVPAPAIVGCNVTVVGLSDPMPMTKDRGWRWEEYGGKEVQN